METEESSPITQYHEPIVNNSPIEMSIVQQTSIYIGAPLSTCLVFYNSWFVCKHLFTAASWGDQLVKILTIIRVVAFIPRPYLWKYMLKDLDAARRERTPQRVAAMINNSSRTSLWRWNTRFLRFYWIWLISSFITTHSLPSRGPLLGMLRRHILFSIFIDMSVRFGLYFFFIYLKNTTWLERNISIKTLNKYSKLITIEDIKIDNVCAICSFEYKTGDKVRLLRCEHRFHIECVDPWIRCRQNSCPTCRAPAVP
eukprot:GHVL01010142.1.p1 GENE.GHVL01010142.1~~GHVL01010142.1.p1  ORF type:complete len:255 (+),score=34.71 GHVL01010142.1:45-809(+)